MSGSVRDEWWEYERDTVILSNNIKSVGGIP